MPQEKPSAQPKPQEKPSAQSDEPIELVVTGEQDGSEPALFDFTYIQLED
ncbi:MAG: hypothetical protein ACYTXE_00550 [Nostoc sp.]